MSYMVCSKEVPSLFDELQETLTLESDKDNKCSILRRKYFNTEAGQSYSNEEIINLRKKLFKIDGVKEYLELEKEIRLFSKKISNTISSVVDNEHCEK